MRWLPGRGGDTNSAPEPQSRQRAPYRGAWYADPYGGSMQQRWWDGTKWTTEVRSAPADASIGPPPLRSARPRRAVGPSEERPREAGPRRAVGLSGGTLRLAYSLDARAWELRRGREYVGQIAVKQGAIAGDGRSWTVVVLRRRGCVVFEALAADAPTAAFYPRPLVFGGTLALAEHRRYRLHPVRDSAWLLVDQDDTEFLRFRKSGTWSREKPLIYEVVMRTTSETAADMYLVTLAATFAFLSYSPWSVVRRGRVWEPGEYWATRAE